MFAKLEQQFAAELDRLVGAGAVTVALSGGGDSVALLLLTVAAGRDCQAAHLDHGLRPESEADLDFCRQLCSELGVEFHSLRVEVAEVARQRATSVEAAGRQARYEFLRELGRPALTGHTLEDQAETVVMRLLEGCSLAGLSGVHPNLGDWLFRPLLKFRRQQLRKYLESRQQSWLEDPSNRDHRPRARIRADILPLLRRQNPSADESLARLAEEARQVMDELESQAREWLNLHDGQAQVEPLLQLSTVLRAQVLRLLLRDHDCRFTATHLRQLEQLCSRQSGKVLQLPGGLRVRRTASSLRFYRQPAPAPPPRPLQLHEGNHELPEWGICLRVRRAHTTAEPTPRWVVLDGDRLGALELRGRRPGDRLRVHGRRGGAKLKKLMQESGIPQEQRDRIPILGDESGPVWVIGHWVSREHTAGQNSKNLWELRAQPLTEKPFSQD